jgi:hypothetical protein
VTTLPFLKQDGKGVGGVIFPTLPLTEKTEQASTREDADPPGREKITLGKLLLKKFQPPIEDSPVLTRH